MTRPRAPRIQDKGMTLIELIIVLAVFALMATLSLQALSGTLRNRDRLVALEQTTKNITLALTLLRADLQAAVPLVFYAPDGRHQAAFDIFPGGQGLAFSVSGRQDLPGEDLAGLGRVIWRFDRARGVLLRQSWPVLIPANPAVQTPEVVMATGITALEVRRLTPELLWLSGPDPDSGRASSSLPRAIELRITSAEFGPVSTLVSYP